MKTISALLTMSALALGSILPARAVAVNFQDFDPIDKILYTGVFGSVSHSSSFNIATSDGDGGPNTVGFNPLTDTLTSGSAVFELWGTVIGGGLQKEKARFNLGSTTFSTPGQQILGTQVFGGTLGVSLLADLQADGIINYSVSLIDQGFFNVDTVKLVSANLTATGERNVPDSGATLVLLGLSLAAVAGFRARRA